MYHVLHIMTGNDGGISAVVRNYYTYMDKEKIHFDIACITEFEGNDIHAMKQMGSEIFHLPMKALGIRNYVQGLKDILNRKKYDAIHVHENATSYIALKVAKQQGVKCRVAHAHSSLPYTSIMGEIRRLSGIVLNGYYATALIGCGELAGDRVFGKWNMRRKKSLVLHNTVDFGKYAYDEEIRTHVRKKLGISDRYIVGMVGRLSVVKNQWFALHVIKKYHDIDPNAILLLIGDGEEEENIRNYISENQLCDYVKLLGKRTDVADLYQAIDVLLMPSIHEGYPLVAVEALLSGLPVLMSSNITKEFSPFDAVHYISLENECEWMALLEHFSKDKQRENRSGKISQRLLDIQQSARMLETVYCDSNI